MVKEKSAVTSTSMSQRQFRLSLELNWLIPLVDVKNASFLRIKKIFFEVLDNVLKSNAQRNEMYSHTVLRGGHFVFSFWFSSYENQSLQVSWQPEQGLRQ